MKTQEIAKTIPTALTNHHATVLLWCLLGLLLPRATLYGEMSPFGIGLAAAVTVGQWPVTLSLIAGYLFAEPVSLPFRYVATVAVVGGARWVVAALPDLESAKFMPPLISLVSTLATGLVIYGQTGMDGFRLWLIIAESIVAAGSTLFFSTALALAASERDAVITPSGQASLLFMAAIAAMAAATITVEGFSPGRAATAMLVLILARTERENGGCLAGCILGSAMALSTPGYTAIAVSLALGGLLAGAFAPYGRIAQTAVFLATAGIITLAQPGDDIPLFLYELLAGGVTFLLLPRASIQRLVQWLIPHRDIPAAQGVRRLVGMRLQLAALAMRDVGVTVTAISRRLEKTAASSPTAIYRDSSRTVCEGCPLHALCWQQHREDMLCSLEALTPVLQQQGQISTQHLSGYAAGHCRRPEQLVDYINRSYEQYLAREGAWRRLRELQDTVQNQFAGTGTLLQDLTTDLEDPQQIDAELSARVLTLCRDFGMPVKDALCTRDRRGRLTVDILTTEEGIPPAEGRWMRQMRTLCGENLTAPITGQWGQQVRLTLAESARYRLETAVARRLCDGEKLCGDTVEIFEVESQTVAVLSDGMGCGGRAAVDGAMAAGLTARLWQAGFRPQGILQTVNAALQVKSREESLATLDVAVIDNHSGRLDSYKAGAATSLLLAQGRVSRLERPSLPLGILPDVTFEHSHDRLAEGDILLLCSDGAFPDGVAPMEILLQDHPTDETLQQLVDRLADAARTVQQKQDDITVVAMQLQKSER